jgi:hypothetical protein
MNDDGNLNFFHPPNNPISGLFLEPALYNPSE